MSRTGNIRKQKVPKKTLFKLAKKPRTIRVGATKNIRDRINQYKNDRYSGKFYYAKTTNMRYDENKLLSQCSYVHNVHKKSNISNKKGNVYAIKGRKYSR